METTPAEQPKRLITHSEDFHTDDVFATALLLEIFPDAEVVRSRDEAVLATGDIVYDVGKVYDPSQGRYDHHQAQAGKRENGITYSAFGLLWKEYGLQYCHGDQAVADRIDQRLIVPVDANDNGQKITDPKYEGVEPFTVDSIVRLANPLLWQDEAEDYDTQFHQAVGWAGQMLRRLRAAVQNDLKSQAALMEAYHSADDKQIIVMDKPASVDDVIDRCPELLYLISPRPGGSWGVLAVAEQRGSYTPKRPFPATWRAQSAEALPGITGVSDAIFCHATGFFAVALSREGAQSLARASLDLETDAKSV